MLEEIKEAEQIIDDLRIKLTQTQALYDLFVTAQNSPSKSAKPCEGLICLPDASRAISEHSSDWVSCCECLRKYHFACEGIVMQKEIIASSDGAYWCIKCQDSDFLLPKMIDLTQKKALWVKGKLDESLESVANMKCEAAFMEDIVIRKSGPCAKGLIQALKQLGVDLHAYYTCSFVGNHMHKMLTDDGPSILADSLGDDSPDRDKYKKLFTGLGRIQQFFTADFLDDDRIEELEQCCEQFACDLKESLPNESVTPKMHFLTAHIPAFARRHRTLGLISEQPLESLHARINKLERQYSAYRDVERQMRMVAQELYIKSSVL
uniref:Zinc finger PHD-type domain-containing protein n=1 Tax=Plectus sambesii TaxID=2011161 RepID=A0A914WQ97_9BILA